MKYLTKIAPKRRYMRSPEFISGTWIQEQWKVKHPTINLNNVPVVGGNVAVEPGLGDINTVDWTENDIQSVPISWNCHLQLTNGVLNYKFTNTTESKVIFNINIPMNLFANAEAMTLWKISDTFIEAAMKDADNGFTDPVDVDDRNLINSFAESLPTRSFQILPVKSNIVFFVPKYNPAPDEVLAIIVRPWVKADGSKAVPEDTEFNIQYPEGHEDWADHTVTFTGNLTEDSRDPVYGIPLELIPEITVTSSTVSGEVITVNFTADSSLQFIYLTQDSGYLPKTKIPVTNGAGSFKVVTTGMDAGDTVKVKLGYKYWVSRNDFTKTL